MSDSKTPDGKTAETPEDDLSRYLPDAGAALSEDAHAGLSTPIMDLTAALFVAALALWMTIESLRLPVPGKLITAPGLLPFITATTLLIMAGILAVGAWNRQRTAAAGGGGFDFPEGFGRSIVLGILLTAYIAGLQFIPVDYAVTIGGIRFMLGSFELVSVVALTAILRIYSRIPLWLCLVLTIFWIAFLSIAFRNVFHIQLP